MQRVRDGSARDRAAPPGDAWTPDREQAPRLAERRRDRYRDKGFDQGFDSVRKMGSSGRAEQ